MRHLKYARYLLRHKWYVFHASRKLGVPWLGLVHDWSKLRPDEWGPYATYFYGTVKGQAAAARAAAAFQRAWLAHLHRNKHHPQHWRLQNDTEGVAYLEIPERYVREMVADWLGAGMAIKGHGWEEAPAECRLWWLANKDAGGYAMHHHTLVQVAQLLDELERAAALARAK